MKRNMVTVSATIVCVILIVGFVASPAQAASPEVSGQEDWRIAYGPCFEVAGPPGSDPQVWVHPKDCLNGFAST